LSSTAVVSGWIPALSTSSLPPASPTYVPSLSPSLPPSLPRCYCLSDTQSHQAFLLPSFSPSLPPSIRSTHLINPPSLPPSLPPSSPPVSPSWPCISSWASSSAWRTTRRKSWPSVRPSFPPSLPPSLPSSLPPFLPHVRPLFFFPSYLIPLFRVLPSQRLACRQEYSKIFAHPSLPPSLPLGKEAHNMNINTHSHSKKTKARARDTERQQKKRKDLLKKIQGTPEEGEGKVVGVSENMPLFPAIQVRRREGGREGRREGGSVVERRSRARRRRGRGRWWEGVRICLRFLLSRCVIFNRREGGRRRGRIGRNRASSKVLILLSLLPSFPPSLLPSLPRSFTTPRAWPRSSSRS